MKKKIKNECSSPGSRYSDGPVNYHITEIKSNFGQYMHCTKNVAISDVFKKLYIVKERERRANGRMLFCWMSFGPFELVNRIMQIILVNLSIVIFCFRMSMLKACWMKSSYLRQWSGHRRSESSHLRIE